MTVRTAGPDDAAAIAAILEAAFDPHREAYTAAAFAATTPSPAAVRARLAEGPMWVAQKEGSPVGTVSAVPKGEALYVRSMAVLPSMRGAGVGGLLLRRVEAYALANGFGCLLLSTTPFLDAAIRLYSGSGFGRIGDGPHDLHGTPLLSMRKDLRPDNAQTGPVPSSAMDALPTAAIADACVRLQVPARAVVGVHAVLPGRVVAGPVLPVQHAGSVDVFFEALQSAKPGQVLCIDNGGRLDEGCIGDLTALEAQHHGCAAILVDGAHRDTSTLRTLGLPVWSRGTSPFGPLAARPRPTKALEEARIGGHRVTAEDVVALDDDGAVFVPAAQVSRVWALAARIQETEAEQARLARSGQPLCEQFQVQAFLAARKADPTLGFRQHLRSIGKAIEE